MALVLKDRVRQTSTTAGTGTLTLSGSVTGYQNFTVIGSGNTTYYTITDAAGNWEVGLGTYTSPNQLSRDTVYESSNANALVNFSSASKDVFVTFPAEGFSSPPAIGDTSPNTIKGTFVTGNTFTAINSSQTGNALNSATNTTYGTVKVLPPTGNVPKIEFDGTSEGYEKLTINVDTYFTGIKFTATGAYGSVFYSPITFVDTTTNNDGVTVTAAAGSASYNLALPPTSGSNNQILKTDGSGNLDWTAVQINTDIQIPPVTVGNGGTGVLQMVDGLDGYDYLNIYTYDPTGNVAVKFPAGIQVTGGIDIGTDAYTGGYATFAGNGATSGNIKLRGYSNLLDITVQAPASPSAYTLTLPTTAGSNNQVLKTDGSGNLSWVNLNAPSIYTTASSQNSTSTALANITGLTATLTANTTYRVDCFVTFQSAATTTGINFGFTSPAGTTCMLEVVVPITNTAAASQLRTIFPNNSSTNTGNVLGTGVSTANSNHTARFSGIIKVGGTGGTFAAQYATEIASSAITIPAGSTMVIQQIS